METAGGKGANRGSGDRHSRGDRWRRSRARRGETGHQGRVRGLHRGSSVGAGEGGQGVVRRGAGSADHREKEPTLLVPIGSEAAAAESRGRERRATREAGR